MTFGRRKKGKFLGRFDFGAGLGLGWVWYGGWLEATRAKAKEARGWDFAMRTATHCKWGGPGRGGRGRRGAEDLVTSDGLGEKRAGWSSGSSSRCRDRDAEEEVEEEEEKDGEEEEEEEEDQKRKRKGGGLAAR
jgi:hypothetical protein